MLHTLTRQSLHVPHSSTAQSSHMYPLPLSLHARPVQLEHPLPQHTSQHAPPCALALTLAQLLPEDPGRPENPGTPRCMMLCPLCLPFRKSLPHAVHLVLHVSSAMSCMHLQACSGQAQRNTPSATERNGTVLGTDVRDPRDRLGTEVRRNAAASETTRNSRKNKLSQNGSCVSVRGVGRLAGGCIRARAEFPVMCDSWLDCA